MQIFDDNLTPEEIEAGFSENEIDNDVFYIEQLGGKYPGDIPEYDSATFFNSETKNNSETNLINSQTIEQENNLKEKNLSEITNDDINIETIDDVLKMEQDNITSNDLQFDNKSETELEIENNTEETIAFDNDFLNLLKEDISKHTKKVEAVEKEKYVAKEVIQYGTSLEVDTSQGEKEFIADLLSMEMETKTKNSNEQIANNSSDITNNFDIIGNNNGLERVENNLNEIKDGVNENKGDANENKGDANENKGYVNENKSDVNENKDDVNENKGDANENRNNADNKTHNIDITKEENMTEEEKQNNKKTFTLIVAIVSVAMILIIGGIVGYLYLSNKQNIPTQPQNTQQQDTIKQDTTPAIKEEITNQDTTTIDTTKTDTTTAILEQPKPKIESKPTTPKHINKTITTTKPVPTEPPATKITEKGTLYTIQVYSSPTKSDAEKRLAMLNRKGISGYITEQNIKGEIWYRVRFGSFEKYEDAKSTIEKYGFKDAWIERIR